MDRIIVYPDAIPLAEDHLNQARNTLIALGYVMQAAVGPNIVVDGLPCAPTVPASMSVTVGRGIITQPTVVDQNAYSTLAADSDPVLKIGVNTEATTFGLTAPTTSGQTVNYLIEAVFQEVDNLATVESYYNSTNPLMPFSGPANSGGSLPTRRQETVSLQLKAGVAATTGTQATPAVDAGWTGLWIITVDAGATQILSGNITQYPNAPWITQRLGIGAPTVTTSLVGGTNEVVGVFKPFAGVVCPAGYVFPVGQALSRTTYALLYAAFGGVASPYGQGDGSTTFNTPDMRGRTPYGVDAMGGTAANRITGAGSGTSATLGAALGSELMLAHVHTITQTPHGHPGSVDTGHGHPGSWDSGHGHPGSTDTGHAHTFPTQTLGGGAADGVPDSEAGGTGPTGTTDTGYANIAIANGTANLNIAAGNANLSIAAENANISINTAGTGTAGNLSPGLACNFILYAGV